MAVPANVTSELAFIQNQVQSAQPLANASSATVTAMILNAEQLVGDIDAAVTSTAGQLDTWVAPVPVMQIISGIEGIVINAEDQASLTDMRGLVGRATSALNQL